MAEYEPIGGGNSEAVAARMRELAAEKRAIDADKRRLAAGEQNLGKREKVMRERTANRAAAAEVGAAREQGRLKSIDALEKERVKNLREIQRLEGRLAPGGGAGRNRGATESALIRRSARQNQIDRDLAAARVASEKAVTTEKTKQTAEVRKQADAAKRTPPPPPPPIGGGAGRTPRQIEQFSRVPMGPYSNIADKGRMSMAPIQTPYTATELANHAQNTKAVTAAESERGRVTAQATTADLAAAETLKRRVALSKEVDRSIKTMVAGEGERARATQAASVQLDQASQGMRKHGAMTTEFIQAAARGQTTFRELRWQAGATIAKFAGWTAAAGAVYAVLGAVTRLGHGAIATHAGVNQLQRVITHGFDTNQMRSELRNLSREMNLPIDDVVEATYLMGQVFHDQNDALTAAKSVLMGVQTGDMDVAQSAQYLTAIVQGFNLEASDMADVLDLINQAQNRLGTSVPDMAQAIAKAAGTWRVAGGDAESLAAAYATMKQKTGITGAAGGTTLGRVPYFIRKPENQEILQRYGIDTNADVDVIMEQIQKVMNRVGPRAQEELAKGFAGPQLGVRVLPLLLDEERYQRNLRQLQPDKRAGASQREFQAFMNRIDQQIKSLGMSLERIGGALAQAGFLDALAVGVGMFVQLMNIVEKTLGFIAELPAPLRQMVVYGIQLAAIFAGMRRFGAFGGAGGGFAGRGGGALASIGRQEDRAKGLVQRGLDAQVAHFQNETERASGELSQARIRAQAQAQATGQFAKTHITAPVGTAEREAQDRAVMDSRRRQLVEEERATRLEREVAANKKLTVAAQRQANNWRQLDRNLVYQEAERQGLVARQTYDQPLHSPVLAAEELPGYQRYQQQGARTGLGRRSLEFRNYVDQQVAAGRVGLQRMNLITGEVSRAGKSYDALARGVQSGADKVARASTSIGRGAQSLRGVPGQLRSEGRTIMQSLGTLDRIFLAVGVAFLAAEGINALFDKLESDLDEAVARGSATPARARDLQARIDTARQAEGSSNIIASAFRSIPVISKPLEDSALGDVIFARDKAEENATEELENIKKYQSAARARGGPVPLQVASEVENAQKRDIKDFKLGIISYQELKRRFAQRLIELQTAQEGTVQEEDKLQMKMRQRSALASDPKTRDKMWQGAAIEEISQRMSAMFGQFETYGATGGDIADVTRGYMAAVARVGGSSDPEKMEAMNSARSSFLGGLTQVAQSEIEGGLSMATGLGDIDRAYDQGEQNLDRALRQMRRSVTEARGSQDAKKREMEQARRAMHRVVPPLNVFDPDGPLGPQQLLKTSGQDDPQLRQQWQRARTAWRQAKRKADTQSEDYRKAREEINKMRRELIELPRFEARINFRQLVAKARTSSTVDTGDDLRAEIAILDDAVAEATRRFGANAQKTLELIADRNEKQHEQFQYTQGIADAYGRLRIARAGGGQAGLQAQVNEARRKLGVALANPKEYSREDIINLQADLEEAQNAAIDDVTQRMASLFDLRAARTRSPIQKARIMLQKARYVLSHNPDDPIQAMIDFENAKTELADQLFERDIAKLERWAARTEDASKQAYRQLVIARRRLHHAPKGSAEYVQAQTEVMERRRQRYRALAQDEIDELEFKGEMYDYTNDAMIAGYERILKMHGIGKEMRRDLMLRIKRLKDEMKDETGLDMEVGNIRLPTVYEIRRAVGAGTSQDRSRQTTISIHNENNLRIERTADAGEVIAELDHGIGTSLSTAYRMAGVP